jgi:hypothetical protein
VDSVNEDENTCDCTAVSGTVTTKIEGVQLMAEVADGMLITPAIDSTVIVAYSKRNVPYVALFSEVDKINFSANDGIELQGDDYGGLAKVGSLKTKLNNIENAFNALNTKLNALAPTPVLPPLVLTIQSEIENERVKHGN